MPRVPQNPRDLRQDDPASERRGGHSETSDGGVPEHVVHAVPRRAARRAVGRHDGGGGRPAD